MRSFSVDMANSLYSLSIGLLYLWQDAGSPYNLVIGGWSLVTASSQTENSAPDYEQVDEF